MTHLCLLAAGSGKRFGSNKLLAELNGRPIWTYGYGTLKQVADETGAKLHVVTRYREIMDAVGSVGVFCSESEMGISYTIRAACLSCGQTVAQDRILFLAADQPCMTSDTVRKMMAVPLAADLSDIEKPIAACAWDGNVTGNPVMFSGVLVADLLRLSGNNGGKTILRPYRDRIARVLCRTAELTDIDYAGDLRMVGKR